MKMLTLMFCTVICSVLYAQITPTSSTVYPEEQGFVDANGVMIYYQLLGRGKPLLVLHGGPGASHDYFLPYLLPLARHYRLVFIDERGSGQSESIEEFLGK
jgi:hypothetical protein